MQRISISIDDELLDVIDSVSRKRGYASRSEALRDILRESVMREKTAEDGAAQCFATLSYVYEHETRDLARRLTNAQHHHHDLSVTTLHVHVNEHDCLEVAVLRGKVADIRAFADSVTTQRGVRLHSLHIMPIDAMSQDPGHVDHHHT